MRGNSTQLSNLLRIDATFSGLTDINEVYAKAANECRVAGPVTELNFGLVEIAWTAQPSTEVTLKAIADDGSDSFTHRILVDELQ